MADDLDAPRRFRGAVAVMEMEAIALPVLPHLNRTADMPVVVAGDQDQLAHRSQTLHEQPCFARRASVVHQVADDDQPVGTIVGQQLDEPVFHRSHTPERHQPARGALADFVPKMQVRHREPPLLVVEKRQPAVEQNIIRHECLVRAESGGSVQGPRKL